MIFILSQTIRSLPASHLAKNPRELLDRFILLYLHIDILIPTSIYLSFLFGNEFINQSVNAVVKVHRLFCASFRGKARVVCGGT